MIGPHKLFLRMSIGFFLLPLSACATGPTQKNTIITEDEISCRSVYTAAFSSDMRFIASGDSDVCLWEIETGHLVKIFSAEPIPSTSSRYVVSVVFSPDNKTIAAGLYDGTLRIWDVASGSQPKILKGHTAGIRAIRYNSNGRYIVSGGHDAVIRLWNAQTGDEIQKFEGHRGMIESIRFSPDNRWILTAGCDGTARLWEIETGKQVGQSEVLKEATCLRLAGFSPDGNRIYIAGYDGSAAVWDITTNKQTKISEKRNERWGFAADLSPDGKMMIAGSDNGIIGLQDSETWKDVKEFHDGDAMVRGITFAPDGKHFATAGYDYLLRYWDVDKSAPIRIFKN